jgi:two-component system, NarL family, nitrate/nitrite sensor histidine kinase NarX
MSRPWNLRTKLGIVGAALLALALASIGLTLWVTWQLEGGAAAVNEAGRMRMQTWRLAQALATGDAPRQQMLVQRFDQTLLLLAGGDPSRPLFVPRDADSQAAFAEVQRGWQVLQRQWRAAATVPAAPAVAAEADAFVARIDAFVTAIENQLARWTAILNLFQMAMLGLVIASGVTLLYVAYLFVFNPLARLHAGLAQVQAGDFSTRIEVASRDEFGALAVGFNRMAETVQGLYRSLEAKVAQKTAMLEARGQRLAALYEASALVARAASLDEMAQGFAQQVRRIAGADAAAVRWSDEDNQRYLLLASDCLPLQLAASEQCVVTGDCHCGQPQALAATRVIPIRADAAVEHCTRAGFQHLVSVPVRLHERVLGEIDLLYRGTPDLADEDHALLDALAAHLAGGMEGLRAAALEREAAVAGERGLLARELHDSIAQGLAFLKIQVQLLRDARRRDDAAQIERVIAELEAGVKESTADVRELLMHFRTRTNAEDITPALQTTLKKFEHQSGLATHLRIEGHGLPLAADVQVQVLHVVQEALSNVRKHAGARQVWIEVQQAPRWRVQVRDDGRGFAEGARDETHVGLRIMRERAERIGAEVSVTSAPGAGTCVQLTLPLAQAPARAVAA